MAQEQFDEERLNIIKQNIRNEGISPADIQGKQIASKELLSTGVPTGAGLNPENLFLLEKALNILKPTQPVRTQSNLISQTSMPPMYDTSPYRALDIIGAGIGRRPTQEAYFNRLETIQNERLQDEYNRRADTPEALNLQSLMKETFPNLGENIINKISPDYISKNYPMIAGIAERQELSKTKIDNDSKAKEFIQQFYPQVTANQLKTITASNYKDVAKKLDDDRARELALKVKNKATIDANVIKEAKKKNDIVKLTDTQAKFKLGLDRQMQGNQLYEELVNKGYDPYSRFNSPSLEAQADNAIREFIYGTLRPESGAVISDDEIKTYKETYFGSPNLLVFGKGKNEINNQNKQRRLNAINTSKSILSSVLPKEDFNEGGIYEEEDGRVFKYTKGKKVYL
jgi:hypothetical protein